MYQCKACSAERRPLRVRPALGGWQVVVGGVVAWGVVACSASSAPEVPPATTATVNGSVPEPGTDGVGSPGLDPTTVQCTNLVQDGAEEGIDCGGPCPSCDYTRNPPSMCHNQFYVAGCSTGNEVTTCGGVCKVANACSPPEAEDKANLEMTFACPRFMLLGREMLAAAADDWGTPSPFNYAVVGHDVDLGGVDSGLTDSTCCQCYQLVFDLPEAGSPQPPELPIPPPLIVQSFNTAAGGSKNFDVFMAAGGYGAFNACFDDPTFAGTSTFGHFLYDGFPNQYPGQGGIKVTNLAECKVSGAVTAASLTSPACQGKVTELCQQATGIAGASPLVTSNSRASCIGANQLATLYHQNWTVAAKRVECPVALTRVTGCRLLPAGLPAPDPSVVVAAQADASFARGYTTTTMQDCCKPTCAWKDWVEDHGLTPDGPWRSFYSCNQQGEPFTQ